MFLETLSSAEAVGGKMSAETDGWTQPRRAASRSSWVGRACGDGELLEIENQGHP